MSPPAKQLLRRRCSATLAGPLTPTSWDKDDGAAFAIRVVASRARGPSATPGGIGVKIRLYARGRVDGRIVSTVAKTRCIAERRARRAHERCRRANNNDDAADAAETPVATMSRRPRGSVPRQSVRSARAHEDGVTAAFASFEVAASGNVRVDGLAPVLGTWSPSPGSLEEGAYRRPRGPETGHSADGAGGDGRIVSTVATFDALRPEDARDSRAAA